MTGPTKPDETERPVRAYPRNIVMHVCPSCGSVFTSPSVCIGDEARTVRRRYISYEQTIASLSAVNCEFPNLSAEDEPWVRLVDVLEVFK